MATWANSCTDATAGASWSAPMPADAPGARRRHPVQPHASSVKWSGIYVPPCLGLFVAIRVTYRWRLGHPPHQRALSSLTSGGIHPDGAQHDPTYIASLDRLVYAPQAHGHGRSGIPGFAGTPPTYGCTVDVPHRPDNPAPTVQSLHVAHPGTPNLSFHWANDGDYRLRLRQLRSKRRCPGQLYSGGSASERCSSAIMRPVAIGTGARESFWRLSHVRPVASLRSARSSPSTRSPSSWPSRSPWMISLLAGFVTVDGVPKAVLPPRHTVITGCVMARSSSSRSRMYSCYTVAPSSTTTSGGLFYVLSICGSTADAATKGGVAAKPDPTFSLSDAASRPGDSRFRQTAAE